MRLAVVADIHGNYPAIEAVAADLAGRRVDRIINLGDCVSGPLWPRETLDFLRTRDWPTVRGNHDRWVGLDPADMLSRTDAFAAGELDTEGRRWLAELPVRIAVDDATIGFHAQPDDDNAYLLEDIEGGRLVPARAPTIEARLAGVTAKLVLAAHSHLAAVIRLPDGRWIVNPGSVGCPAYDDPTAPAHVSESGSPAARYAIIDLDASAVMGDRLPVELLAIPYDHASACRRATALGQPDWAAVLATGFRGTRRVEGFRMNMSPRLPPIGGMAATGPLPPNHPRVKRRKVGVLLSNLGTPDATDYWSMRRYLSEFLSDRRVIETPRAIWWLILNLIILTVRPGRKGKDYDTIWNRELNESPLKTTTRSQAEKLQASIEAGLLGPGGADVIVDWGMRYGNPSIRSALDRLQQAGCDRILLVPLYPQYAAATSATACDKTFEALMTMRWQPALRVAPAYHDDPPISRRWRNR